MLALPATLTIKEASAAVRVLEAAVEQGSGALVVDASALRSFDTAAIAALLELRRQAQVTGRAISVCGAPTSMVELAGLYGVAELLGFELEHQSARA
jgi:phospholipid transport system transporter-binding protein